MHYSKIKKSVNYLLEYWRISWKYQANDIRLICDLTEMRSPNKIKAKERSTIKESSSESLRMTLEITEERKKQMWVWEVNERISQMFLEQLLLCLSVNFHIWRRALSVNLRICSESILEWTLGPQRQKGDFCVSLNLRDRHSGPEFRVQIPFQ